MDQKQKIMEASLLGNRTSVAVIDSRKSWTKALWVLLALTILVVIGLVLGSNSLGWVVRVDNTNNGKSETDIPDVVDSDQGVVAADDGRCSEIGASMLRVGGHAVDAAVATALCVGVVNPMSSGIGGGGFMIIRSSATSKVESYDLRETAPLAASQNMYDKNPKTKQYGALSMGVPGEIAGLHEAWTRHGRLAWRTLFQPAVKLAKDGYVIRPYLAKNLNKKSDLIMSDTGLRRVFAPKGRMLQAGDTCYNVELGNTLERIAEEGPEAFYNGTLGEALVKDVTEAGGILTMKDLKNYRVEVTEAMTVNALGYTIYGMPPPSSGTLGLSLLLNIFESYGTEHAADGPLGLHRLIEALKHMFAIRMNLGDPAFVNITSYIADMLSPDFAKHIQQKILDNTTFPPDYYMYRWSQLQDHGTSHFCIVDSDRNAVSMTTTVNWVFGAGVLSTSTGIVLNNEMDDFSIPTEISPDKLPPSPSNFIEPFKRPLSSMTPVIVMKDNQLVGVIGGSGGLNIIPAVVQVFVNYFILGMDPLDAVQSPRIYHKLIPNVVLYENETVIDGDHIELSDEKKLFLKERGHELQSTDGGAICQLVVQKLQNPNELGRKFGIFSNDQIFHGTLTAVSDPRKDGRPAAV